MKIKKILAFTLAEVLITLTILGVVAAITVPVLQKQNYKKTQISRMAKAYASLENAAANIATNSNCIGKDLKCTGLLDLSDDDFINKFVELSGFRVNKKSTNSYRLIKSLYCETHSCDGAAGEYRVFYTTPDNIAYSVNKHTMYGGEVGISITIFTDKDKASKSKAAIMGRDAFVFLMHGNFEVDPRLTVLGCVAKPLTKATSSEASAYINKYCDPNTNPTGCYLSGVNCTAKIIKDGWKMKY